MGKYNLMSTLESVRGIKDLEAVCKSTQKLNNRVSEFDGGSFLILVVGPVKSGKSTLVNLIAHAHVSPTHFLECTVRPSIISKGQEESITRIFSVADKARKVEQFDSVIVSLRGVCFVSFGRKRDKYRSYAGDIHNNFRWGAFER